MTYKIVLYRPAQQGSSRKCTIRHIIIYTPPRPVIEAHAVATIVLHRSCSIFSGNRLPLRRAVSCCGVHAYIMIHIIIIIFYASKQQLSYNGNNNNNLSDRV